MTERISELEWTRRIAAKQAATHRPRNSQGRPVGDTKSAEYDDHGRLVEATPKADPE